MPCAADPSTPAATHQADGSPTNKRRWPAMRIMDRTKFVVNVCDDDPLYVGKARPKLLRTTRMKWQRMLGSLPSLREENSRHGEDRERGYHPSPIEGAVGSSCRFVIGAGSNAGATSRSQWRPNWYQKLAKSGCLDANENRTNEAKADCSRGEHISDLIRASHWVSCSHRENGSVSGLRF
jgi:hypothetical protein